MKSADDITTFPYEVLLTHLSANPKSMLQEMRVAKINGTHSALSTVFAGFIADTCVKLIPDLKDHPRRDAISTHAGACSFMVLESYKSRGFETYGDAETTMLDAALTAIAKWIGGK